MRKICFCLRCHKEFTVSEIGEKEINTGWGVCPECGGRVTNTDSRKLIPILKVLGEKNYAVLHSDFRQMIYPACKYHNRINLFCIMFHFAVEPGVDIENMGGYTKQCDCDNKGIVNDICISKSINLYDDSDLDDIEKQELDSLTNWVNNLPKLDRDPSEY